MSFKLEEYKDEEGLAHTDYHDSCLLKSGQMIKIEFQEERSKSKCYYFIYLAIMDKRKSEHNIFLKSTGKDGLSGLIWARNKIKEFEEFIIEENPKVTKVICCHWDDNRRRNAYAYGLKKIGYKFNMVFGYKALCKTIV